MKKVSAPYQPNPKWPQGYYTIQAEMGIKRDHYRFYVGWVRDFFKQYPRCRRRDLGRIEIEAYIKKLHTRNNPSWQIQQARDALEWYYGQFPGIDLAPYIHDSDNGNKPSLKASRIKQKEKAPINWKEFEKTVRNALRVGHYSLKTEQTYWP